TLSAADIGKFLVVPNIGAGVSVGSTAYYSVLSNVKPNGTRIDSGGSGYSSGQVLSFDQTGGGAASQVQIVVDSVGGGAIHTFHFLNYCLFTPLLKRVVWI